MEINNLELLPKIVEYNGSDYSLEVHVTAFNRLCVAYQKLYPSKNGERPRILSYTVEPERDEYIPKISAKSETSELNEHIGNCKTLDKCIDNIRNAISQSLRDKLMKISVY